MHGRVSVAIPSRALRRRRRKGAVPVQLQEI